jgi:MFS family permease
MIGSLLSFGFQHYHGKVFTSWQILFLVVGLITICLGTTVLFFLPDSPIRCKFLTREEKLWTIERLRENQTGIENKTVKPDQILECFMDPQTWLLSLIMITANVPNGAVSSFQATIIKGFGYNSKQTALLQLPSGAVSIVSVLVATYSAGRWSQRGLNIVFQLLPGILGACLLAFLPNDDSNKVGLLIGNYLTNTIGTTIPLVYSWVGANYAGHTKKVNFQIPFHAIFSPTLTLTDNHECRPIDLILSGKHRGSSHFHGSECPELHPSQNHDHRHLLDRGWFDVGTQILLHVGKQAP